MAKRNTTTNRKTTTTPEQDAPPAETTVVATPGIEPLVANVHGIGPDTDGGPNPDYNPDAPAEGETEGPGGADDDQESEGPPAATTGAATLLADASEPTAAPAAPVAEVIAAELEPTAPSDPETETDDETEAEHDADEQPAVAAELPAKEKPGIASVLQRLSRTGVAGGGYSTRRPQPKLTGPQAELQAAIYGALEEQGLALRSQGDVYGWLLDQISESLAGRD